jgi:hypothetical protein
MFVLLAVDRLVDRVSRFPGRASAAAKYPRDADVRGSTRISVRGSTPHSFTVGGSRIRGADERSGPALRAGSETGRSVTHKPVEKCSWLVRAGSSCLRDAGRLRPVCPTAAPLREDPRLVMSWHARRHARTARRRPLIVNRSLDALSRYVGSWLTSGFSSPLLKRFSPPAG